MITPRQLRWINRQLAIARRELARARRLADIGKVERGHQVTDRAETRVARVREAVGL